VETSNASGWPFYAATPPMDHSGHGPITTAHPVIGACITPESVKSAQRRRLTHRSQPELQPGDQQYYGSDGIRILDTGDDSIQIGSPPDVANYGVYIPSPGVSTYGIWSNTANASGEWAFYSVDNVQAGNVLPAPIL